jgi:hypothetical protein
MGFYIRKGFNFGPLRLNLSRSGLGASIGVPGARFGVGPRGSYVHLGRGGFYYRKTLSLASLPPRSRPGPVPSPPVVSDDIQEISSADATTIVDVSATDLLQELNRIKRRFDIFPVILTVAAPMMIAVLVTTFSNGLQPWFPLAALAAATVLAVAARHYDVTNGTVILNYSLGPEAEAEFSRLQTSFQTLAACHRVWHLDALGHTLDWKHNAGASSLISRSDAQRFLAAPPKVICNVKVPAIKAKRKALYFFPDRLLVYDSSGVGAIRYSQLQTSAGHSRFVESEYVPGDATQVGTTWRSVSKAGGPDRRFNNNRQFPILQYGILALQTAAGLNELFQCSAAEGPTAFATEISAFSRQDASTGDVSFETLGRGSVFARVSLGVATLLMGALTITLISNLWKQATAEDTAAAAHTTRLQFAAVLSQTVHANAKHNNVSLSSSDDALLFAFTNEGPKASRRDGLTPFNKKTFFREFLVPKTECDLCSLGFKRLELSANGKALPPQALDCAPSQNPAAVN